MSEDYEPTTHFAYPHTRYRCPCGQTAIAIGWEVQTLVCGECGSLMNWDEELHDPRGSDD